MKPLIKILLVTLACISLIFAQTSNPKKMENITQKIDAIIQAYVNPQGQTPVHNISLLMNIPSKNFYYNNSLGKFSAETVQINHPVKYKIASISKTFTATIILQLVEEGKIKLSDKLYHHLKELEYIDFNRLSVYEGQNYGKEISIEHLLSHRSGINDYFINQDFLAEVMKDTHKQWSGRSIIETFFKLSINLQGVYKPGDGYFYSDVNYVLLGLLIENITQKSLADNYLERIFLPLGMDNSYLQYYQNQRGTAPLSYPFLGDMSLEDVNTSFDWAGGGIVSTSEDLDLFIRALLKGKLYQQKTTLSKMLEFQTESTERFNLGGTSQYGLGVRQIKKQNLTFLGHSGSWGCIMYYNPENDFSIVVSLNQSEAFFRLTEILDKLVDILKQEKLLTS